MPDRKKPKPVRVVFLGGLGEIGRNCACLEVDGRILIIDCGLMFPDLSMPGVDLVLPDFSWLRENADRVEACVLTHGHEDHVGALAYLLRDLSFPIYGSTLTLGLARSRIDEQGLLDRTELIPVLCFIVIGVLFWWLGRRTRAEARAAAEAASPTS